MEEKEVLNRHIRISELKLNYRKNMLWGTIISTVPAILVGLLLYFSKPELLTLDEEGLNSFWPPLTLAYNNRKPGTADGDRELDAVAVLSEGEGQSGKPDFGSSNATSIVSRIGAPVSIRPYGAGFGGQFDFPNNRPAINPVILSDHIIEKRLHNSPAIFTMNNINLPWGRANLDMSAELLVAVDSAGRITKMEVVFDKPSGGDLGFQLVKALRSSHVTPQRINGMPVGGIYRIGYSTKGDCRYGHTIIQNGEDIIVMLQK